MSQTFSTKVALPLNDDQPLAPAQLHQHCNDKSADVDADLPRADSNNPVATYPNDNPLTQHHQDNNDDSADVPAGTPPHDSDNAAATDPLDDTDDPAHGNVNADAQLLPANKDAASSSAPNGANEEGGNSDFPSYLVDTTFGEPPIDLVTFDIPDNSGQISPQVFERDYLIRYITHQGQECVWQDVIHPIIRQRVNCNLAMSLIRPVSHYANGYMQRD